MSQKTSKFRFTKPTACSSGKEVTNVAPTSAVWDCGNFLAVNEKHIAVPWSQIGAVVLLGHHEYGKVSTSPAMFTGHQGPVIDLAFNPFEPDMLATASEDATIRMWKVPESGLKGQVNTPVTTLTGHSKKVGILAWHPAAHNVLASSGPDAVINLWDANVEAPKIAITTAKDQVSSVAWSLDGTMLATTTKDKKVNIVDSRTGEVGISADGHASSKTQRLVWAKRRGLIVTVGFSRQQFRQAMVWDVRNMEKPVCTEEIDQQSSVMAPWVDEDTNVLYVSGKGDGSVKMYDLWEDAKPIVYLNQFSATDAQRGVAFMPKKSLSVKDCEVARMYRLTTKTLHHVSFAVPRKTGAMEFQADLFPPTFSDIPAFDSTAFFGGKNGEPNLVSMEGHFTGGATETIVSTKVVADSAVVASPVKSAAGSPAKGGNNASPAKTVPDWDGKSEPTQAQLKEQESQVAALRAELDAAEKQLAEMRARLPQAAAPAPAVAAEEKKDAAPAKAEEPAPVEEAKPVAETPTAQPEPKVEAAPEAEVAKVEPKQAEEAKPAAAEAAVPAPQADAEEPKKEEPKTAEKVEPAAEETVKPAAEEAKPAAEEAKPAAVADDI